MRHKEDLPLIAGGAARSPPPNAWKIFLGAVVLLLKSWKLVLPLLLVWLVPQTFLSVATDAAIRPLILDMLLRSRAISDKSLSNERIEALLLGLLEDFRKFTAAELAAKLIFSLILSFFGLAVIIAVAMASKADTLRFRDLLWKTVSRWKGFVVTLLYANLLLFAYPIFWLLLPAVLIFVFKAAVVSVFLAIVLFLLGIFLSLYLEAVLCQGLVISATEEGRYGLTALGRAAELIHGRKALGCLLQFLKGVILTVALIPMRVLPIKMDSSISAAYIPFLLLPLAALFTAVNVEFYHECKKSHGEEEGKDNSSTETEVHKHPVLPDSLP